MVLSRLWAGWRMAYVSDGDVQPGMTERRDVPTGEGSLFERILHSGYPDEESLIVWRGERCFAVLNAHPYGSGHVLVLPNRAVGFLEELTADESAELWTGINQTSQALRRAYDPHGINVGFNLGAAAGASVAEHLHAHCIPRWNGDTNFMSSIAETRVLPESLDVTWQKVTAAWPT